MNHLRAMPLTEPPPDCVLNRIRVDDLFEDNPKLYDPVIEGWVRECEVMNVIAAPKFGKSWWVYYVMFCVAMGWSVFGRFPVKRGRVLLIDLELHKSLISSRLQTVATALHLDLDDYRDSIDVVSLRGDWKSMEELLIAATSIMPGEYVLVVIDSKYRLEGGKENDNNDTTAFHNRADRFAEITGAAVVFIHHQTKGDQSGKRVTDMGAGGGAQSRAADTHLVLREHEDQNVAVIEAAVRSFPPLQPLAIRWEYPLWIADEWADTTKLAGKQTKNEERTAERDREGMLQIVTALLKGPATAREIRRQTGISKERCDKLLGKLEVDEQITSDTIEVKGNTCRQYHVVGE